MKKPVSKGNNYLLTRASDELLGPESDPEKLHRGALLLGGASGNISHFRPDLFFFLSIVFYGGKMHITGNLPS